MKKIIYLYKTIVWFSFFCRYCTASLSLVFEKKPNMRFLKIISKSCVSNFLTKSSFLNSDVQQRKIPVANMFLGSFTCFWSLDNKRNNSDFCNKLNSAKPKCNVSSNTAFVLKHKSLAENTKLLKKSKCCFTSFLKKQIEGIVEKQQENSLINHLFCTWLLSSVFPSIKHTFSLPRSTRLQSKLTTGHPFFDTEIRKKIERVKNLIEEFESNENLSSNFTTILQQNIDLLLLEDLYEEVYEGMKHNCEATKDHFRLKKLQKVHNIIFPYLQKTRKNFAKQKVEIILAAAAYSNLELDKVLEELDEKDYLDTTLMFYIEDLIKRARLLYSKNSFLNSYEETKEDYFQRNNDSNFNFDMNKNYTNHYSSFLEEPSDENSNSDSFEDNNEHDTSSEGNLETAKDKYTQDVFELEKSQDRAQSISEHVLISIKRRILAQKKLKEKGVDLFLRIVAFSANNEKEDMEAVIQKIIKSIEDLDRFELWLQEGIEYYKMKEVSENKYRITMEKLLGIVRKIHPIKNKYLDRQNDKQVIIPNEINFDI